MFDGNARVRRDKLSRMIVMEARCMISEDVELF